MGAQYCPVYDVATSSDVLAVSRRPRTIATAKSPPDPDRDPVAALMSQVVLDDEHGVAAINETVQHAHQAYARLEWSPVVGSSRYNRFYPCRASISSAAS